MHTRNPYRRTAARRASHVERLEIRQLLSSTLQVGPAGPYHTIQSAVNAAHKNDTILVSPGTYVEQVVVPASLTGLEIQSKNGPGSTIIQAPATLTGTNAIVTDLADKFEIDGFTIQGPANGISAGLLVTGGASKVEIDNNQILHIHDAPKSGNQSGYGIEVMGGASAQINGDTIADYQKNGIEVRDAGTTAAISGVTVTGDGPTAVNTQNGIVFFNGAGGSVSGSTVSKNQTLLPFESGGILAFNASQVSIYDNVAFNNDGNIILDGPSRAAGPSQAPNGFPTGSVVDGNETYGATFDGIALFDGVNAATIKDNYSHDNGYDGLLIDNTSTGNRIDSNVLIHNNRSNVGAWDLEDDTFGQSNTIMGDGGTANFYKNDVFGTTNTSLRSKFA
ncbi:MAG TPA: right-handed parallel beta-helix repeat-containing protein [Tepidisphaeraceae bacterium]|jgi:hypothetical protein